MLWPFTHDHTGGSMKHMQIGQSADDTRSFGSLAFLDVNDKASLGNVTEEEEEEEEEDVDGEEDFEDEADNDRGDEVEEDEA